ncbi:DUF429 domain-containing protein [Nakamurella leprariae]|uniref:DUF429 domain-containing protein n=1 Tax=Nakamurella leprariae TaxID=2803911 RepID=A0A938YCM2_9ACTN|nr:DUF429 domain-containing protein [Nakamurella leprariae]MBM9467374.1 DUF429 domain-containing protein [Nakamurella leprariae]
MRTAGIDLAAQPERTGAALLRWAGSPGAVTAVVESVGTGVDDDAVVRLVGVAAVTGLDVPLGWPDAFVDLMAAIRSGTVEPSVAVDRDARRRLTFRRTDEVVHEVTGRRPLSVSADLIAHPAMRAAGLLARLQAAGVPVSPDGIDSAVAEVYPAASLRRWDLLPARRGPKTDPAVLGVLVDRLRAAAPWLDLAGTEPVLRRRHDAFDAVVAALVARAVQVGRSAGPAVGERDRARREGWIHLPDPAFLRDPS